MQHSTKTMHNRVRENTIRKPTAAHSTDEIVRTLSLRVRCMTVHQIARTWWPGVPDRTCVTRLKQLASSGRIEMFAMLVHPEVPLLVPLAVWQPGQDAPDLGSVANRARQRWTLASVSMELVVATEAGANRCGGVGGRRPRTSEATHDVHLAGVYLRLLEELPTRSRSWKSEAVIASARKPKLRRSPGERLPDSLVRDGRASTAIEFVGDYSPDKLRDFHHYCRRRGLGYELW